MTGGEDARSLAVTVVDLSMAGAAVECRLALPTGGIVRLNVIWAGLSLSLPATVVANDNTGQMTLTRLAFGELQADAAVALSAFVSATQTRFLERQRSLLHRRPSSRLFSGDVANAD